MLSLILEYMGLSLLLAGVAWGCVILYYTRPTKKKW